MANIWKWRDRTPLTSVSLRKINQKKNALMHIEWPRLRGAELIRRWLRVTPVKGCLSAAHSGNQGVLWKDKLQKNKKKVLVTVSSVIPEDRKSYFCLCCYILLYFCIAVNLQEVHSCCGQSDSRYKILYLSSHMEFNFSFIPLKKKKVRWEKERQEERRGGKKQLPN